MGQRIGGLGSPLVRTGAVVSHDETRLEPRPTGPIVPEMEDGAAGKLGRGETFWSWFRSTARLWGFLGFILIVLIIFRKVVLPFMLAALVTYVLAPVLRALCQIRIGGRHFPRPVWLISLYMLLFGFVLMFVLMFVPRLGRDVSRIVHETPQLVERVNQTWLPRAAAWVESQFGDELELLGSRRAAMDNGQSASGKQLLKLRPSEDGGFELDASGLDVEVGRTESGTWRIRSVGSRKAQVSKIPPAGEGKTPEAKEGSALVAQLQAYLRSLARSSERGIRELVGLGQRLVVWLLRALTTFILVLMISAFLLLDTERLLDWLRNLIPSSYHTDFDNVIVLTDRALGGAIRGQLLICVVNGVLTGIGLFLIGVKYALVLAVVAGVMSLIPIFGSILSTIPIVVVALVSGEHGIDLLRGALVLGWIIVIHLLEANLLNPKIIGTAARIHPVIVIFAVVAGQRTYGAMGALFAVPIVSAVQAMFVYIRAKVRGEPSPR